MRVRLVPIGNSRGVRLPKSLIQQYGLLDEVELEPTPEHLVIRRVRSARTGWEAAFEKARSRAGDDELLDADSLPYSTTWDRTEWKW